jgi:hypothetical protein
MLTVPLKGNEQRDSVRNSVSTKCRCDNPVASFPRLPVYRMPRQDCRSYYTRPLQVSCRLFRRSRWPDLCETTKKLTERGSA